MIKPTEDREVLLTDKEIKSSWNIAWLEQDTESDLDDDQKRVLIGILHTQLAKLERLGYHRD